MMKTKFFAAFAGILYLSCACAVTSTDGGYTFVFSGDYADQQTVSPTGTTCLVVLENANFNGGFSLPSTINGVETSGMKTLFKPKNETTNTFSKVTGGKKAEMVIDGKGVISLTGPDTLLDIPNLTVKNGTLKLKSTGVTTTKTAVAEINWDVKQEGGVIDLDIGVPGDMQIYGFRVGKKKEGKASFGEGEFRAKIGGWKSAAVYADSLAKSVEFKKKLVIDAELLGPEARFANVKCDLTLKNCNYNITMPESYASITNTRAFKSDKSIFIDGGTYEMSLPGPGSEAFSALDSIVVSNGTFNVFSSDDCFSAMTNIVVEGGQIYATSNDDVFDSNGNMTINGGTILAYTTAEGHEAFDVYPEETESGSSVHCLTINGGVIFATGGPKSAWPANMQVSPALKRSDKSGTAALALSGKFRSFVTSDSYISHALLPTGDFRLLLEIAPLDTFVEGFYTPAAAPKETSMRFQNFYVTSAIRTYQENVRFLEIYGSTSEGGTLAFGDVGEYIVLTNLSSNVVNLKDFRLTATKDGDDAPSVDVTFAEGEKIPANGFLKLEQADYSTRGWTKITNGEIVLALIDLEGATVQSGKADFDRYPQADGLGASLIATSFLELIHKSEWIPSFFPPAMEYGVPAGSAQPVFAQTSTGASVSVLNVDRDQFVYTYKCAETLEGLADADPVEITSFTPMTGATLLNLASDPTRPQMFYQLYVNYKKVVAQ